LATILGTLMGLARLSRNWLVAQLAGFYAATFRNIPRALHLLFWWGRLREMAPAPRQAWQLLPGIFVSNRGITFPVPFAEAAYAWMAIALVVGLLLAFSGRRWGRRQHGDTRER